METYIKIRGTRDSHDIREVSTIQVADLIDRLREFPADAKVVISFDGGYTYGGISYGSLFSSSVETYEEEREREEREENECLVCPHCGSENICIGFDGRWSCLELGCGKSFRKAKIARINNQ